MPETLIYATTNLGDSAVTGALAVSLAVYLLGMRQRRAALAVMASFVIASLIIALGKLALYSRCDATHALFDLQSPSGHTATSMAVYGMFAALVSSSQTGKRRVIPYLVAAPLIALITASRVVLNYHTTGDVIVGLIVGLVASLGAGWFFMRGVAVRCRWWPFTIIALIVLGALYGSHFPAEDFIGLLSEYIRAHIRVC